MDQKQKQLAELKEYIENIDKETTLLLQNLQWDHKHLLRTTAMVSCKYDPKHRIPSNKKETHESQCYLKQQGYNKADILLPDPIDPNATTVVKLSKEDIKQIINRASSSNPSFKRVRPGAEPLSAERLQQAYPADVRRAIHDAVVAAAPSCHDLADLALASHGPQAAKEKSRTEILAELRDMKRRPTKYRVAAKTRNYSDMLRDVIKTQMELYAEAKGIFIKTEYGTKSYVSLNSHTGTYIVIKQERVSPENESCSIEPKTNKDGVENRGRRRKDDREPISKKGRGHYSIGNSSTDKTRYRNDKHDRDKYVSNERKRCVGDQFRSDKHYKIKEEIDTYEDRSRHEAYRKATSDSKISQRYGDDLKNNSKPDRDDSSRNRNKHEAGYREPEKRVRSHKYVFSGSSRNHYHRKRQEYQKSSTDSDGHREKREYYVQVKEEKDDDYIEKKRRRRH